MPWEKRHGLPGVNEARLRIVGTTFGHFRMNDCGMQVWQQEAWGPGMCMHASRPGPRVVLWPPPAAPSLHQVSRACPP
jgi:hypothetical protein